MENKDKIIGIACRIAGISLYEIHNSRADKPTYARLCVYRHYFKKDYHHTEIAQLFGQSRCTITRLLSKFRSEYSRIGSFVEIYSQFTKETKDL